MPNRVEKVIAYVTRVRADKMQLLVFEHVGIPEAGLQVPAGTVDPDESPSAAVLREVEEESGLSLKVTGRDLGRFKWYRSDRDETHFRNIFHFETTDPIPDEWIHVVGGSGEDRKLHFRFCWIPIVEAPEALAADQGLYLKHL